MCHCYRFSSQADMMNFVVSESSCKSAVLNHILTFSFMTEENISCNLIHIAFAGVRVYHKILESSVITLKYNWPIQTQSCASASSEIGPWEVLIVTGF